MSNQNELEDLEVTTADEVTGGGSPDLSIADDPELRLSGTIGEQVKDRVAGAAETGRQAASTIVGVIKHGPDRPE